MCKYAKDDPEFIKNQKFQRNAKEIFESNKLTGFTDYAIVFAIFARQLGIPTTFLHTAEFNWCKKLKSGERFNSNIGHSFYECFYEGKWVLVDPTFRKIEWEYNSNLLTLSYKVGGNKNFIPYFRDLDLGKRQNIKQHNDEMNRECMSLH